MYNQGFSTFNSRLTKVVYCMKTKPKRSILELGYSSKHKKRHSNRGYISTLFAESLSNQTFWFDNDTAIESDIKFQDGSFRFSFYTIFS